MKDKGSDQDGPSTSKLSSELSNTPREKTDDLSTNSADNAGLAEIDLIEQRMEQIMRESVEALSLNEGESDFTRSNNDGPSEAADEGSPLTK